MNQHLSLSEVARLLKVKPRFIALAWAWFTGQILPWKAHGAVARAVTGLREDIKVEQAVDRLGRRREQAGDECAVWSLGSISPNSEDQRARNGMISAEVMVCNLCVVSNCDRDPA